MLDKLVFGSTVGLNGSVSKFLPGLKSDIPRQLKLVNHNWGKFQIWLVAKPQLTCQGKVASLPIIDKSVKNILDCLDLVRMNTFDRGLTEKIPNWVYYPQLGI